MKTKTIFLTMIITLCVSCLSFAQDDPYLVVDEIQICTSVEDRVPAGSGSTFSADIEKLYCFTRLKNKGEKSTVIHAWYYNDKEMARVELAAGVGAWRTWSSKTILPAWIGEWRVDVLSANGNVLATKSFEIK